MIEHDCFTKSWIDDKRQELRVMDPGLLEKGIHALELLGHILEIGEFDLVFKGILGSDRWHAYTWIDIVKATQMLTNQLHADMFSQNSGSSMHCFERHGRILSI